MKGALTGLFFLIPGEGSTPVMIGRVGDQVSEGIYLCFFQAGSSPIEQGPGRLIKLARMMDDDWHFYHQLFRPKPPPAQEPEPAETGGAGET